METAVQSQIISLSHFIEAKERLLGISTVTPCMHSTYLSQKYEASIWLKREDLQVVRSFKIRGAYNKMRTLSKDELAKGVICASAGNHAQGFALSCKLLDTIGHIYMPTTTPKQKMDRVRFYGHQHIEIHLVGDTFDHAQEAARLASIKNKMIMVHPFDDVDVIAGQGTIGMEILDQVQDSIDYLIGAIGGGGMMSGVGSYFKTVSPDTTIIGVEAKGAPAYYTSRKQGSIVTLPQIDPFADGIAVKSVSELTYNILSEVIDDMQLVSEGKLCSSILELYNEEAIVVEPAGVASISALDFIAKDIKGKNVVCIVSGGNNDILRTAEIKERALLYEKRKHYFIIKFPQRAGALKGFLDVLGPNDDITHFEYTKKNNRQTGPALVGIELNDPHDFISLIDRMKKTNIYFEHINDNPLLFEMLV